MNLRNMQSVHGDVGGCRRGTPSALIDAKKIRGSIE